MPNVNLFPIHDNYGIYREDYKILNNQLQIQVIFTNFLNMIAKI